MSNRTIVTDLKVGCRACIFERDERCMVLDDDASDVPDEGAHEDCPLQDDQVVEVIGRRKP